MPHARRILTCGRNGAALVALGVATLPALVAADYSVFPLPIPVAGSEPVCNISDDGHFVTVQLADGTIHRWHDAASGTVTTIAPAGYNNADSQEIHIADSGLIAGFVHTTGNRAFFVPVGGTTATLDSHNGGGLGLTADGLVGTGFRNGVQQTGIAANPILYFFGAGAPTVVQPTIGGIHAGLDTWFAPIATTSTGYVVGGTSDPGNGTSPYQHFKVVTDTHGAVQSITELPAAPVVVSSDLDDGDFVGVLADGTGLVTSGVRRPAASALSTIFSSYIYNGTTLSLIPPAAGRNALASYAFARVAGTPTVVGESFAWDGTSQTQYMAFIWSLGQSAATDPNSLVAGSGAPYVADLQGVASTGQIVGSTGPDNTHRGVALLSPLPDVSVSAPASVNKSAGHITLTVTRAASSAGPLVTGFPLTVPLQFGGDAVQGADFTVPSASVVIAAGQPSATLLVTFIADTVNAPQKTLTVTAAPPVSTDSLPDRTWRVAAGSSTGVASNIVLANPATTLARSGSATTNAPVTVTVTFSSPVTGFTDGELTASTGTLGTLSGSGAVYTATWTPPATATGSATLSVAAGVATATGGTNAAATDLVIPFDTQAPAVPVFTAPLDGATVGANLAVTGTLPEAGLSLVVAVDGTPIPATVTSGFSASVTGLTAGSHALTATATDGAGNTGATATIHVTVDLTPPTLTFTPVATPTRQTSLAFSGTTNGTAVALFDGATALGAATVSGGNWTFTASGVAQGSHVFTAVATNALANTATVALPAVLVDTTAPTIALGAPSALVAGAGSTVTVLVTYADASSGLGAISLATGDLLVSGSAAATATVTASTATAATITLTGFTGNGAVTVAVVHAGTAVDLAGNQAPVSAASAAITVDTTPPTVALSSTAPALTAAAAIPIQVVFSEPVTGVAEGDFTVTGGAVVAGSLTGSGATYTVSVAPGGGALDVTYPAAGAADAAGNGNTVSNALAFTADASPVTVTVNQASTQADPTSGSSIVFTAVFSHAVTGFTAGGVVVGGTAGGTLVAAVSTTDNTTWTITVTGMATSSGTVTAAIPADVATNTGTGDPNAAATSTDASVGWLAPAGSSGSSSKKGPCGLGSGLSALLGMSALLLRLLLGARRR